MEYILAMATLTQRSRKQGLPGPISVQIELVALLGQRVAVV